jgi:hypothetical protein
MRTPKLNHYWPSVWRPVSLYSYAAQETVHLFGERMMATSEHQRMPSIYLNLSLLHRRISQYGNSITTKDVIFNQQMAISDIIFGIIFL